MTGVEQDEGVEAFGMTRPEVDTDRRSPRPAEVRESSYLQVVRNADDEIGKSRRSIRRQIRQSMWICDARRRDRDDMKTLVGPDGSGLVQRKGAEGVQAVPIHERTTTLPPLSESQRNVADANLRLAHRYWPTGCQTVFSSRKLAISHGLWTSDRPWTTRLTFCAAARSSSGRSPSAAARSIAFTSMCAASQGASSARWPVSRLTTPPGTSEVAIASASSIAASGCVSEATAMTAFPPVSAGTTRETRPSSGGSSGARTATTPVGSGTVKLKYGPATGFDEPSTCASLSAQPAYQTIRSTVCSTSSRPLASSANSDVRASTISASRYRTWPRLYAVMPAHFGNAPRAARTASRASLRDARATFCPSAS